MLLQEINLKIDRSILTGVMSLLRTDIMEENRLSLFEEDTKFSKESIMKSVNAILESQSTKMLIEYFHLSPVKIHLSFSLEGQGQPSEKKSSEEDLLEWLISTIGIHFTDISDAEIKLVVFFFYSFLFFFFYCVGKNITYFAFYFKKPQQKNYSRNLL